MKPQKEQVELVKDHFDKASTSWADLYAGVSFNSYNFIVRRKHVIELLDKTGGRFLDAGCGTGDFIPELLERGGEVFAMDFAEEMVEQARSRFGSNDLKHKVHFSAGDVYNLDFPDDFFDAIIAVGLIEYLTDVDKALNQLRRVLKPEGILIVTAPNIASPFRAYETGVPKFKKLVKRALATMGLWKLEPAFLQRSFLPWNLDGQLKLAGLKKLDYAFCTYGLSGPKFDSLSLRLSKRLDRFANTPFGVLGTNYIVKVQKP